MTEEIVSPYWNLNGLFYRKIYKRDSFLNSFIEYHSNLKIGETPLMPSFRIIKKIKPITELTLEEIGIQGEKACFRFVTEAWKKNAFRQNRELIHHNEISESYKPYDISFGYRSNNNIFQETTFIDVKTTRYFENVPLHISISEAKFIKENYSNYFIARVFPLIENQFYYGIQISSSLGMNIYKFNRETKLEFIEAVDEMTTITGGDGFKIKTEWLMHTGLINSDTLGLYFKESRTIGDFGEWRPVIFKYFRVAGVFDGKDEKLLNLKVNVDFNELFFLLKWIMTVRQNHESAPELIYRITVIAKNWNSTLLEPFLNEVLTGQWDDDFIFYFLANLLAKDDFMEIDSHIAMLKASVNNFKKLT